MGAWIEISPSSPSFVLYMWSCPSWARGLKFAKLFLLNGRPYASCPSWARGLKFDFLLGVTPKKPVVPLMGAWIEISGISHEVSIYLSVVPLMGAWIEIYLKFYHFHIFGQSCPSWARGLKSNCCASSLIILSSCPSWARGLKSSIIIFKSKAFMVAPLMGAWIEILSFFLFTCSAVSRAPHGRVD